MSFNPHGTAYAYSFGAAMGANALVGEFGREIRRLFDPKMDPVHSSIPESQLIANTQWRDVRQLQFRHPQTSAIYIDRSTMVVSIDGACRNNGKASAKASRGVFFGPGSKYNARGLLDAQLPNASSRAEIEALSQALNIIWSICRTDFSLTNVYIISDSEYVVKTMSMWISQWIGNNGRKADGNPAAHFAKLQELHEQLDKMEYGEDGGITVKFWHRSREENKEADALANQALDE